MPNTVKAVFFAHLLLVIMIESHAAYGAQEISGNSINGTIAPTGCSNLNGTTAGPCDSAQATSQGYIATKIQPMSVGTPLQQTKSGVLPQDVTCMPGMVLVQNAYDNSPACVTPDTAQKLVARGWGKMVSQQDPFTLTKVADFRMGQRVGAFTISEINPGNVTGYYNSPYPIQHPGPGVFTTMHIGDTLNPTCDGSAPLVITSINYPASITVTMGNPTTPRAGGCPICLSGDSMIATPSGEVNIKDVRDGMTVLSADSSGHIILSEVLMTHNVFVGTTHHVIDLKLADGRELFASPNHPTYDGRTISDLKAGEHYDGSTVASASLVKYKYEFTYDILPDSQTGDYFANGILVGSTLK